MGGSARDPAIPSEIHEPAQPSRQFLHGASAVQAAVWIVARLADGLEHAHSRGLLHRDLKPSNVLLAADGTPMLLDFNLAVDQALRIRRGRNPPHAWSAARCPTCRPNISMRSIPADRRRPIASMSARTFTQWD